jgi:hypothetical protein
VFVVVFLREGKKENENRAENENEKRAGALSYQLSERKGGAGRPAVLRKVAGGALRQA